MREDVRRDWVWADQYEADIRRILYTLAHEFVDFRWGTEDEDLREATDFVVQVDGVATVAGRVRKLSSAGRYRDLSLRHSRDGRVSGRCRGAAVPRPQAGIEEAKVRRGFARWYLYIWVDDRQGPGYAPVSEWVFVDLDMLRSQWPEAAKASTCIGNRDGMTAGRYIPVATLHEIGAIVRHERPQRELELSFG